MSAPTPRRVRLLRRLRVAVVALVVVWLFSPPSLRNGIPVWLPFLALVALEAQFVLESFRDPRPATAPERKPGAEDRERFGTGGVADWAVVEADGERIWVDLDESESEDEIETPPAVATSTPSRPRRVGRALVEAAAALAAVAALVLILQREDWEDLSAAERRSSEARISSEASRVAGKPVRVGCDTSGRRVGAVQHADGVAVVGGDIAYLTPELCYALHRLAADGAVDSFSGTARAIAVLAHEAWHLRGVRDEARTECFALQSGVRVGIRLGLDETDARRMMRSQLVANQARGSGTAEYRVTADCINRGRLDLSPGIDSFP